MGIKIWSSSLSGASIKSITSRWPCDEGFHIPTATEWSDLSNTLMHIGTDLRWDPNTYTNYLLIPPTYYILRSSWEVSTGSGTHRLWLSKMTSNTTARAFYIKSSTSIWTETDKPANGFMIRAFKDKFEQPDSTWTTMYDWSGYIDWYWIFWNPNKWVISIVWEYNITIQDHNAWNYYQFWNNHWFPYPWPTSADFTTTKPALSDNYWPPPLTYYDNDKFVKTSNNNWFTWNCNNIWWWDNTWLFNVRKVYKWDTLVYYKLPNSYQEVEYIETSWTQYLNTKLTASSNLQTEAKIWVVDSGQEYPIFWCWSNDSTTNTYKYYHLTCYQSKWYWWINWWDEWNWWTYTPTAWTLYTVVFNNSSWRVIVNNVDIWSCSWTSWYSGSKIAIARRWSNSELYYAKYKYYYFKIYNKSSGIYTRYMIPCYRKSDNVIWMYDIINGSFYTNAWSWTFIKWPDVN